MSLFSKFTKNAPPERSAAYPWTQRKLGGSQSSVLPRYGHAAAAAGSADAMVLFGGTHMKSKKDLFLIDTNNMTATAINATGDIPSPRMNPVLAPLGNACVLLYGGEPASPDEKWDPNFYTLNLVTRMWGRVQTKDGRLPVERSGHSVALDGNNDIVYFWGGQRAGRYLNDLFAFNASTHQWDYIPSNNDGPAGRSGHVSCVFENTLYIFGGTDGDHLYNDVWAFDLQQRFWRQVAAVGYIPVPREGCASSMVGDVMYVFGGRGPDGQELGDLCAFKVRGQRWFMFQNMGPAPSPRFGSTFAAVGDKIIAMGGESTSGKSDENPYAVHVLDCTKIRYPPEPQQQQQHQEPSLPSPAPSTESDMARSLPSSRGDHSTMDSSNAMMTPRSNNASPANNRPRSQYPEGQAPPQAPPPQRPPRHTSMMPSAAMQRAQHTASPLQNMETNTNNTDPIPRQATMSPTNGHTNQSRSASPAAHQQQHVPPPPQRPPRPSREGVSLTKTLRKDTVSMYPDASTGVMDMAVPTTTDQDEMDVLMRDIRAQDAVISAMKKKESWWRTEVSIARRMRLAEAEPNDAEADEQMLMDMNDQLTDAAKLQLYEQLVSLKAELRRVQSNIGGPSSHQAMSERIHQVDRIRTAALQEAAYWKSKYMARAKYMKEEQQQQDEDEEDVLKVLEHKLASTLMENEQQQRLLQHLNKQAQHDHEASASAQERAKEAHERAEEARHAHERAIRELELLQRRAEQAELRVEENNIKLNDLSRQLEESKTAANKNQHLTLAQEKIMHLTEANTKVQNEACTLTQELDTYTEDIEHLRAALQEREEALTAATREVAATNDKLARMKEAVAAERTTPTPTSSSATTTRAF